MLGHKNLPTIASFVLLVATQIALPLMDGNVSWLVSLTVVFLACTSLSIATRSIPPTRLLAVTLVVFIAAFVLELIGSKSGIPFGEYRYTDALRPALFDVPLIVPLAWVAMVLPALQIGRSMTDNRTLQCLIGGWALMAWDLFLDPMMVDLGYWVWADEGSWQGIPWSNYIGWFVSGSLMCAIAAALTPSKTNTWLIGIYIWMTGFSALGFVIPFAFDVPIVGVVGAVASLPLACIALVRAREPWPAS